MGVFVERIGPTIVYSREAQGFDHEVDVILVHGLFGHPKNTWTLVAPVDSISRDADGSEQAREAIQPAIKKTRKEATKELLQEVFWPQDLLPKVLPMARIVTWGYDVQVNQMLSSVSNASILHHSETLLGDVDSIRKTTRDKRKPLIFIAHSLGGIVVKDALSLAAMEHNFSKDILPATKGVMFLGTPHHGSKVASLGKIAFELSKIFFQKPNLQLLRALESNSETLERISRSFGQVLSTGSMKVHSFREELATGGVTVVHPESAAIGYLHETRGSIHDDHRNMAKFSSVNDIKFKRVSAVLLRWLDEMQSAGHGKKDSILAQREDRDLPDALIFGEMTYEEQYQLCLQSMASTEARERIAEVESPFTHTYSWLFDDDVGFGKWLRGDEQSPVYWIRGKPGSGKSTMMKYAMNHEATISFLKRYDKNTWHTAAYFFHDRGTVTQKSIEGLLREILYQLLRNSKNAFDALLPSIGLITEKMYLEALVFIAKNTTTTINLCLFVDALDEHDGNQRVLLSVLAQVIAVKENPNFRVRACLASRPENVFKDAFRNAPGLIVHERTIKDTQLYTTNRIYEAIGDGLKSEDEPLRALVQNVVERAEGVFLWIRLVVDEIVEGLCEGDGFDEVNDLLSTIPTELEGLYTRAIRRKRRISARTLDKDRIEAYIMFQIAVCSSNPLPLPTFVAAALLSLSAVTAKHGQKILDLNQLSESQMERRLNSRCSGLLEATTSGSVQFIHRTVKEYMGTETGKRVLCEHIAAKHRHSGHVYLTQYFVHCFETFIPGPVVHSSESSRKERSSGSENDVSWDSEAGVVSETSWLQQNMPGLMIEDFIHHAQIMELDEGQCASKYIRPIVMSLTADAKQAVFPAILRSYHHMHWPTTLLKSTSPNLQLLLLYILCGLPLSTETHVSSERLILDYQVLVQLADALTDIQSNFPRGREISKRMLEALEEAITAAHIPLDERQELIERIRHCLTEDTNKPANLPLLDAEMAEGENAANGVTSLMMVLYVMKMLEIRAIR